MFTLFRGAALSVSGLKELTTKTQRHKDTKILFFLVSLCLGGFLPSVAGGAVIELEAQLEQYIAEGLEMNPDLDAWRNKVDALNHAVPQAGAWMDPTVSLGMMNLPANSFDLNQEPMTGLWLNIGQSIPLAGIPALKTEIAEQHLKSTLFDQNSQELSVGSALAKTWFEWAYLKAALQTVEKNIDLVDDLIVTARTKYETGRGMQQDVLRAETKRTQLEDMLAGIRQMELTTRRKFAVLLGRQGIDELASPGELPAMFPPLDIESSGEETVASNPSFGKAVNEHTLAASRTELARKSWFPDLKLGAGYGIRQNADSGMERPDFYSITAGVSIPVFGSRKQSQSVQEMASLERVAESKLNSVKLELKFQLERLLDEDRRLAEQLELYQDGILPQAEATLAASSTSYATGKADFESLLMAESVLYNARLEMLARVRDRLNVRVSIAALIGDASLLKETSEND